MKTIFQPETNAELLSRLDKLREDTQPLWGKMDAAQMAWHCQKPMQVASGELTLKTGLLGKLFGKWAKNDMIKKQGFGKNLPTAPEFKARAQRDFAPEKQTLRDLVSRFGEKGADAVANKKHPFFGLMHDEEWGNLMYIHLDHHLKQFGL